MDEKYKFKKQSIQVLEGNLSMFLCSLGVEKFLNYD